MTISGGIPQDSATVKRPDLAAEFAKALSEVGLDNPAEFDKRFAELTKRDRTQEESLELAEINVTRSRLLDLRKPLYDEKVDLGDIKTMPYDAWHALQTEDKASMILNGIGEELLEKRINTNL